MSTEIALNLTMRPDEEGTTTLTQPLLGAKPYVLIQLDHDEARRPVIEVESGGGVPPAEDAIVELVALVIAGLAEGEEIAVTPSTTGRA